MRGWFAAALAATVSALAPTVARAEVKATQQAATADATFLAYAPAASAKAAVCLVDSGVDVSPDTAPLLQGRGAIDGGDGGDVDPVKHGTLMAMVMGAPANDWGMVGAWPHVRIESLRAQRADGSAYSISDYVFAITQCVKYAPQTGVKVINLSLGSQEQPDSNSTAGIDDAIQRARDRGINVVAAAGNKGNAVDAPANAAGAFAVGANDATGTICSFSARGNGLDLLAPGCDLQVAIPATGEDATASGTSEAAAFTSGVLAALRSYRPELTVDEAERLLTSTARTSARGPVLDVRAAFHAAGLDDVIQAGDAAIPAVPAPPPASGSPASAVQPGPADELQPVRSGASRLVTPQLRGRLERRGGRVAVRVANRPVAAVLRVSVQVRRGGRWRTRAVYKRLARTVTVKVPQGARLLVGFEDVDHERPASRLVTVGRDAIYDRRS